MNYQETKAMYQKHPFLRTHARWLRGLSNLWVPKYVQKSKGAYAYSTAQADVCNALLRAIEKMDSSKTERQLIAYFTLCVRRGLSNGLQKAIRDAIRLRPYSDSRNYF